MRALVFALVLCLPLPAMAEEPAELTADGLVDVTKDELWKLYLVTASRRDIISNELKGCQDKLRNRDAAAGSVEVVKRLPGGGAGDALRVLYFVGGVAVGGAVAAGSFYLAKKL